MRNRTSINLSRSRGNSVLDNFITWALTIGRVIVIITESVALSAFLYRFTLDRQIIDLHGKIKQEQAIVKVLNKNEITYRNLQDRLSIIGTLAKQTASPIKTVQSIYNAKPSDITLTQVIVSEGRVEIDASVLSVQSLNGFMKSLKRIPELSKVGIEKVQNKTTTASIIVQLIGTIKKPN